MIRFADHYYKKNKNNITKFFAGILISLLLINLTSGSVTNIANAEQLKNPCNCVIFRLDDVNSEQLPTVQMTILDKFISENQTLSLGIIMNRINESSVLVETIKEGKHAGLFELDLHGWEHVDFTQLSENEQFIAMEQSNQKMNKIFGIYSNVFIPPYNKFNGDTIEVLKPNGIQIISSDTSSDRSDYFVSQIQSQRGSNNTLYHMPAMTTLEGDNGNGTWIKIPIQEILDKAYFGIAKYGYAVILLHPQNFAKFSDGHFIDIIDETQLNSLAFLINTLKTKNIPTSSFAHIVGLKSQNLDFSSATTPEFYSQSFFVLIVSLFGSYLIFGIYKRTFH